MAEKISIDLSQVPAPVTDTVETLDPKLAPQVASDLGLTQTEYEKVCETLGRVPSLTELYIYSLMWSEHCSYKHSKRQLRNFSCAGDHVLQGPGENAGVIDVGDGWAVAFKMESHNHPSAIEPFQGAATGVGGIIRDIFTMGARPIACLDSLRFGTLDKPVSVTSSMAAWPALEATATAWAFPPWVARCTSTSRTRATAS